MQEIVHISIFFLLLLSANIIEPKESSRNGKNSKDDNDENTNSKSNKEISTPEDCARPCRTGSSPKTCYFQFTLELYTTVGSACKTCVTNTSNVAYTNCQCVLADGVEKTFLSVNRMLPGPGIQVCENDKVVIDVDNRMEGLATAIHWHGILHREDTQYFDGVPFITQCPILDGNVFRYHWIANAGTHFWHAHTGTQKLDGIYGSIIVRQPQENDVNGDLYDYDLRRHVILISDWLHELADERFPGRRTRVNGKVGQNPDNILINGKGQYIDPKTNIKTDVPLETFSVAAGKRYRFRLINAFSTVCPAELTIEGHNITVITTDGEPIKPVKASTIISFSGERYDFVLEANNKPGAYWIQLRGVGVCSEQQQQLAILRYVNVPTTTQPESPPPTYTQHLPQTVTVNPINASCLTPRTDSYCVNQLRNNQKDVDEGIFTEEPDLQFYLPFRLQRYNESDLFKQHTYNKFLVTPIGSQAVALINNISYSSPASTLISQYKMNDPAKFCNGTSKPEKCDPICSCTHKLNVPLNAIVELIIVDEVRIPTLSHPFHLHGFAFNVVAAGRSDDRSLITLQKVIDMDQRGLISRCKRKEDLPPAKDTMPLLDNGYIVLRFRADNPGFWFFHCHFLYHINVGMDLVFQVGSLSDLPPVPRKFPQCGNFLPPIKHIKKKRNKNKKH